MYTYVTRNIHENTYYIIFTLATGGLYRNIYELLYIYIAKHRKRWGQNHSPVIFASVELYSIIMLSEGNEKYVSAMKYIENVNIFTLFEIWPVRIF